MVGETIFTVAAMADFVLPMLSVPRTIESNYNDMAARYAATKSVPPSESTVREARRAFLQHLNVDRSKAFHCPLCGDTPDTFIMDAITLGFKLPFLKDLDPLPVGAGRKIKGM